MASMIGNICLTQSVSIAYNVDMFYTEHRAGAATTPLAPHSSSPATLIARLPGLRFYRAVARQSFRRNMAYRAANLAGMATNIFWGVIRASVFTALFMVRPSAAGMTLPDALTYGWITEGLMMVTWLWGWTEIAEAIRSGDIVADMARPYHYQTYWLFRDLGRALFHVLFRGLPVVAAGVVLYPFVRPTNIFIVVAFVVSVVLGTVTSFAWRFLVNLTAFWTTDVRGMAAIAGLVAVFLSGEQAPLAFYPAWLQAVAAVLPFQAMIATPLNVYFGHATGPSLLSMLALQAAWAVALLLLGRYILARGYRKVVIHGG